MFHKLVKRLQHHCPILLRMTALFFSDVVVLGQESPGLVSIARQLDRHCVIVLRSVRHSRERAKMAVL